MSGRARASYRPGLGATDVSLSITNGSGSLVLGQQLRPTLVAWWLRQAHHPPPAQRGGQVRVKAIWASVCLTVRSTPDPTPTMSQFSAEPHQYSIYTPNMRLGSGRSTLALGINEASVHEWRAWRGPARQGHRVVRQWAPLIPLSTSPMGSGPWGSVSNSVPRSCRLVASSSPPSAFSAAWRPGPCKSNLGLRLPNSAFDPGPNPYYVPIFR